CIVEYLTIQRRQEKSVEKKIRRHTVTFRRTLRNLLLEGMANGELRPFKISQAVDIIFSLMESMVIKIMFYDETDRELLFRNARNVIRAMRFYSPLEEQNNG
ncbi:MAG: hypothetical protein IJJ33_18935, partial [Victivallales bacterium]|nr:hypothetical protein [Victivallales bacterium]